VNREYNERFVSKHVPSGSILRYDFEYEITQDERKEKIFYVQVANTQAKLDQNQLEHALLLDKSKKMWVMHSQSEWFFSANVPLAARGDLRAILRQAQGGRFCGDGGACRIHTRGVSEEF
jgi:hypothetical protein